MNAPIQAAVLLLLTLSHHHYSSCNLFNKSITFPGIGTFNVGDFSPPRISLPLLPYSPAQIDLKFLLFTSSNRDEPEVLLWNDTASIEAASYFDGTKASKVIVPGYTENMTNKAWMSDMKDAFLNQSDLNIFIVDWSGGNGGLYEQAIVNARVAGPMVAIQIQRIVELKQYNLSSFHLISHSLGCHVAGYAGKFLNGSLPWITGLDPAGPLFRESGMPTEAKLWYTDAAFVDVIHTYGLAVVGFGMEEPCGTVDLYPNGGITQPGCWVKDRAEAFKEGLSNGINYLTGCDHYRSWEYYIEAIQNGNSPSTRAYRCPNYETFKAKNSSCSEDCGPHGENCVYLGPKAIEYSGSGNRVRFYLETNSEKPWFD